MKTGQYRDHLVDDIVDRCFVMFHTRYHKGRPRGFPPNKEVYVCEARYNEDRYTFNRIKTWTSCLPDEVRERDYEMDLYPVPRRLKKEQTPIAHLLADNARETDPLPKPNWGHKDAPPIIGGVHMRPREPNVSRVLQFVFLFWKFHRHFFALLPCRKPAIYHLSRTRLSWDRATPFARLSTAQPQSLITSTVRLAQTSLSSKLLQSIPVHEE